MCTLFVVCLFVSRRRSPADDVCCQANLSSAATPNRLKSCLGGGGLRSVVRLAASANAARNESVSAGQTVAVGAFRGDSTRLATLSLAAPARPGRGRRMQMTASRARRTTTIAANQNGGRWLLACREGQHSRRPSACLSCRRRQRERRERERTAAAAATAGTATTSCLAPMLVTGLRPAARSTLFVARSPGLFGVSRIHLVELRSSRRALATLRRAARTQPKQPPPQTPCAAELSVCRCESVCAPLDRAKACRRRRRRAVRFPASKRLNEKRQKVERERLAHFGLLSFCSPFERFDDTVRQRGRTRYANESSGRFATSTSPPAQYYSAAPRKKRKIQLGDFISFGTVIIFSRRMAIADTTRPTTSSAEWAGAAATTTAELATVAAESCTKNTFQDMQLNVIGAAAAATSLNSPTSNPVPSPEANLNLNLHVRPQQAAGANVATAAPAAASHAENLTNQQWLATVAAQTSNGVRQRMSQASDQFGHSLRQLCASATSIAIASTNGAAAAASGAAHQLRPPSYQNIPGIVPYYHGRSVGPPPSYEDVINPYAQPPTYQSLFGQMREARKTSRSLLDLLRRLLIILISTLGCTILIAFMILIPFTMIIVGAVYIDECRIEHIPAFLLVGGLVWASKNIIHCYAQCKRHESDLLAGNELYLSGSSSSESASSSGGSSSAGSSTGGSPCATRQTRDHVDQNDLQRHLRAELAQVREEVGAAMPQTSSLSSAQLQDERHRRQQQQQQLDAQQNCNRMKSSICESLLNCVLFGWFVAGCVIVFRNFEPDFENSSSVRYCHRTVYMYTFWLISSAIMLFGLFVGCICCLMVSSAVASREDSADLA